MVRDSTNKSPDNNRWGEIFVVHRIDSIHASYPSQFIRQNSYRLIRKSQAKEKLSEHETEEKMQT